MEPLFVGLGLMVLVLGFLATVCGFRVYVFRVRFGTIVCRFRVYAFRVRNHCFFASGFMFLGLRF